MIKAGIIGARGYTGSELVRLLNQHSGVEIAVITSETLAGKPFAEVHPQFLGIIDLELESAEKISSHNLDVVFLALPHGVSMSYVAAQSDAAFRTIDLSGDFRLTSPEVYTEWYQKDHTYPDGFEEAVYGLPELHRDALKHTRLAANPGCYPTSAILAVAPFLASKSIWTDRIVIDSKSGITGAGVKASATTHFSNVHDNFKAYGLKTHRHTIEIEEQLTRVAGHQVNVQFTPHLLPVDRGILSTVYLRPKGKMDDGRLREILSLYYQGHPFVRIHDLPVSIKNVRGTNFCDIYATYDPRTETIIVLSAIDNLVKGAAGQAIQNMNIMFGLPETTGLELASLTP